MIKQRAISLKHITEYFKALFDTDRNCVKYQLRKLAKGDDEKLRLVLSYKIRNPRVILKLNRHRTVYDLIVAILSLNDRLLYISLMINKLGKSAGRLYPLIPFRKVVI